MNGKSRHEPDEDLWETYATVWHEGSKAFYYAKLLHKMTPEELRAEEDAVNGAR
jgi:hypothetical protein